MLNHPRVISLASLLSKGTLSPAKVDELKTKSNILKAFAAEKVQDVNDTIEKATGEL